MLLGCYRKGEASDPEAYITGVAAVLSNYPPEVVDSVTDPRTGIQTRIKFPPNPAEIREACEIALAPIKARQEREAREARLRLDREQDRAEADRPQRMSLEELRAKYGPKWGINPPPDSVPPAMKHYRRSGPLSAEERQTMYAERFNRSQGVAE